MFRKQRFSRQSGDRTHWTVVLSNPRQTGTDSRVSRAHVSETTVMPCGTATEFTVYRNYTDKFFLLICTLFCTRSGVLQTQKLKIHLLRSQSSKVLPLKPGVGQYIAIHATLTTRDFVLTNFCRPVHLPAYCSKTCC